MVKHPILFQNQIKNLKNPIWRPIETTLFYTAGQVWKVVIHEEILSYHIGLEFRSVQNGSNVIKMDLEFELILFYPEGQIMHTALLAHPDLKT